MCPVFQDLKHNSNIGKLQEEAPLFHILIDRTKDESKEKEQYVLVVVPYGDTHRYATNIDRHLKIAIQFILLYNFIKDFSIQKTNYLDILIIIPPQKFFSQLDINSYLFLLVFILSIYQIRLKQLFYYFTGLISLQQQQARESANQFIKNKMQAEIILRIKSPQGQHRITMRGKDSFGQLLLQISRKLNSPVRDLIVKRENQKTIVLDENVKLGSVPFFVDGVIIKVQTNKPIVEAHMGLSMKELQKEKQEIKCNHAEGGRCINCLQIGSQSKTQKKQATKNRCLHGPTGKCLNCSQVDLKDRKAAAKMLCNHGPNGKCVHCIDQQFISDVAHVSFDNWLQEKKLKCKGVHSADVKCNNCLPPSQVRYNVDLTCKQHEAYPKAMCNKCVPPNVVVKRQEYRHVDYVQFMNVDQIQQFIQYWLPRRHEQQRVAYLYGYYAQDPHYKGGIRVIVETLFEPQQTGTYNSFEIINKEQDPCLQSTITGLSLQRVGWLFTETNHDVVMSEQYVRMAADFQQQYKVAHQSGYDISNFITVILRTNQKNQSQVVPEVYMISDQGQALQKAQLFSESHSRRKMQVKVKQKQQDAFPSFICAGKTVTQFQPEFLLAKIAYGSSKSNKFSILKKSQFPPFNRTKPTIKNFKDYMMKNRHNKPQWLKFADFNLLYYLAKHIDPFTAHSIAESVAKEQKINENLAEMIEAMTDL